MCKKGFVSSFFLFYFMVVSCILVVVVYQIETQIKVILNIKKANEFLIVEMIVLDQIECDLKNDMLISGEYEIESTIYNVTLSDSVISVTIYSDSIIYLEIEYNNEDKILLNYSSYM